jgi:hypothetical protein
MNAFDVLSVWSTISRVRQLLPLLLAAGIATAGWSATGVSGAPEVASPAGRQIQNGLLFRARLSAQTHTPKINTRWRYEVRVLDLAGRPIRARITVQIVDSFGGVHAARFGKSDRDVTNWPIKGVFRDFAIWPQESRGFRLIFRVTVSAKGQKTRLRYWVKSR